MNVTAEDNTNLPQTEVASNEGWGLILTADQRWQLKAVGPRFANDAEAIAFVRQRAAEGSEIHAYALMIKDF